MGVEKDMMWFLALLHFSVALPCFSAWSKFWFKWKAWFWAVSASTSTKMWHVYLLLALSLTELLCNVNPETFCACGRYNALWMGRWGMADRHAALVSSAHGQALMAHWTSPTKENFKGKLIETSKKATAGHYTKQGALLRTTGHAFKKLVLTTAIVFVFNNHLRVGIMVSTLWKPNLIFTITLWVSPLHGWENRGLGK